MQRIAIAAQPSASMTMLTACRGAASVAAAPKASNRCTGLRSTL